MSKCIRHIWGPDNGSCTECGEPFPRSAAEIYRMEKMKRGLRLQEYNQDGSPAKTPGAATFFGCPQCGCEVITLRHISKPTRYTKWKKHKMKHPEAHCTQCNYRWITHSKESVGGTRQVEVRG